MSDHSHDNHVSNEQKPVSFTVPFILASVTIFITVMFLSLCDPKPHHAEGAGHETGAAQHEASHHEAAAATDEHKSATEVNAVAEDSLAAESTVPAAGAPEHKAEEHH